MEEKVLARIKKMLTLANDAGATEGERDNATRMAHATMAKYNLDMAQVEASGGSTQDEERMEHQGQFYGRPWARKIASASARLFFCRYIYIPNTDAKRIKHLFIGRKSNAITALEMAQYLVDSIRRESKRDARANGQGNAWARSFALGAAGHISVRVSDIIAKSAQQTSDVKTPGTALVLASLYAIEEKKNDAAVAIWHPKLGKGVSGQGASNFSALARGQAFGNSVSLNRQVGGLSKVSGRLK